MCYVNTIIIIEDPVFALKKGTAEKYVQGDSLPFSLTMN